MVAEEAEDDGALSDLSDDDVAKLQPPRRTARAVTVVVMAMTALAAALLAWGLAGEARYGLGENKALDLGLLATAELGEQHEERYVRARAMLDGTMAADFRRPFEPNGYRIALAKAGTAGDARWVVYSVPPAMAGPRLVSPTLVAGRLARVADLGPRYRGLAASLKDLTGVDQSAAWVLVDGANPQGASWVVGLEVMLLVFLAFAATSIVLVLRRVG